MRKEISTIKIFFSLIVFLLVLSFIPYPGPSTPSFGDDEGGAAYMIWTEAFAIRNKIKEPKTADIQGSWLFANTLHLKGDPPLRVSLGRSSSHIDVLDFSKDHILLSVAHVDQINCEFVARMMLDADIDNFHGDLTVNSNARKPTRFADESNHFHFFKSSHQEAIKDACSSDLIDGQTDLLLDLKFTPNRT